MCKNKYTVPVNIKVDVVATSYDDAEDAAITFLEENLDTWSKIVELYVDTNNINKHV